MTNFEHAMREVAKILLNETGIALDTSVFCMILDSCELCPIRHKCRRSECCIDVDSWLRQEVEYPEPEYNPSWAKIDAIIEHLKTDAEKLEKIKEELDDK